MGDVDVLLREQAREFLDTEADSIEEAALRAIIEDICLDPTIDHMNKFPFGLGEAGRGAIYHDGRFWIIYRMFNPYTLEVWGIGIVEN